MAKVSYANLKLKPNTNISTFEFGGQQVEVLNYLPINDKYDFVMITLQKAEENGIYNPILLDMYFHLHLVYMYTNLSFTDKQKEDPTKLYDMMISSGLVAAVVNAIPEAEYQEIIIN